MQQKKYIFLFLWKLIEQKNIKKAEFHFEIQLLNGINMLYCFTKACTLVLVAFCTLR